MEVASFAAAAIFQRVNSYLLRTVAATAGLPEF
jgi:hypothetical protein